MSILFPEHGRIQCSRCFETEWAYQQVEQWQMRNDPTASGSRTPTILVLGFSKGATQADLFDGKDFDRIAFGGEQTRKNLTDILRAVRLLKPDEHADDKIRANETEFHFASLVRCSLARYDHKASIKTGRPTYTTSGELVTKSFEEIPHIIDNCCDQFLKTLPVSVRLIVVFGVSDGYFRKFRQQMKKLHPNGFQDINRVAYRNDLFVWVHLTHPSRGNGTRTAWLYGNSTTTSGMKREMAAQVIEQFGFARN